jgi:hypothetical protein
MTHSKFGEDARVRDDGLKNAEKVLRFAQNDKAFKGSFKGLSAKQTSVQINLAGSDVGVEAILAWAGLMKRAEEATFGDMEGCGIDFAGSHGAIHLGVVFGIADIDGELSGIDFEVLVSRNIVDVEFAGKHADVKMGEFWNIDRNLKIIPRTTGDLQSAFVAVGFELDADVGRVVSPTIGDTDLTIV